MKNETRLRLPKFYKKYSADLKRLSEGQFTEKLYGEGGKSPEDLIREMKSVKPFKVKAKKQKGYGIHLVLGCIHVPFHNQILWAAIMQLIHDLGDKLSSITLNGDFVDLLSLSAHATDEIMPDGITLGQEYEQGLEALMEIERAIGDRKVSKQYLYGNHENRFFRHVKKLKSSKYGTALISPEEGLKLKELGYTVQPDYVNGYITIGNNLQVHHGHYFSKHSAAKHLDTITGVNHIFNHTHRFQSFSNGVNTAYNTGCLIDINHKAFYYANRFTRSQWKNAFALVYELDDGSTIVNPIECIDSGFFWGGKRY